MAYTVNDVGKNINIKLEIVCLSKKYICIFQSSCMDVLNSFCV